MSATQQGQVGAGRTIVIVGGGVFGFTAAIELRGRGWTVTVLDQGQVPHPDAASTDLNKVVRLDYGADPLYTEMAERSIEGWHSWNAEWERSLFHQDGFLVMTRDETMRPGGFEAESFRFLSERGHPLHRIGQEELAARHPAWNAGIYREGYLNPAGGWAESGAVVRQLRDIALARGVVIRENVSFGGLIENSDRITGVRSVTGDSWSADIVLMATGAWTPFLFPELTTVLRTTAQPVIQLRPELPEAFRAPAFPVWGADIGRFGWYGFPANADGIVKVANHGPGRPVTDPNQPRGVTDAEINRFRAFLAETFPSLADAPIAGTRECWYCDSFDGHFWIDHYPDRPGLIVAAGDSGHAFKFAPMLGGLIADVVEQRPNPWRERFQWREALLAGGEEARARE